MCISFQMWSQAKFKRRTFHEPYFILAIILSTVLYGTAGLVVSIQPGWISTVFESNSHTWIIWDTQIPLFVRLIYESTPFELGHSQTVFLAFRSHNIHGFFFVFASSQNVPSSNDIYQQVKKAIWPRWRFWLLEVWNQIITLFHTSTAIYFGTWECQQLRFVLIGYFHYLQWSKPKMTY